MLTCDALPWSASCWRVTARELGEPGEQGSYMGCPLAGLMSLHDRTPTLKATVHAKDCTVQFAGCQAGRMMLYNITFEIQHRRQVPT